MTYDEAVKIVDAGGIVVRESEWFMSQAGFAWAPWISLERRYTKTDLARAGAGEMNVVPSGSDYRVWHTLCESVGVEIGGDWENEFRKHTDWIDVTDRFTNGVPKGYTEYMYPKDVTPS